MRPSAYVLLFAVLLSLGSLSLRGTTPGPLQSAVNVNPHRCEAAYRDGIFVGKYHRLNAMTRHPTPARWSAASDRALFVEGYERGFSGSEE